MAFHFRYVDWSFTDHPMPSAPTWHGLSRSVLVGAEQGAIHTELAVGVLKPRQYYRIEGGIVIVSDEPVDGVVLEPPVE